MNRFRCVILLLLTATLFMQIGVQAAENQSDKDSKDVLVVARVGDVDITESIVLEQIDQFLRASGARISPAQMASKNTQFFVQGLERAIVATVMTTEAEKQEITVSSEELDENISDLKKQFESEEEFKESLAAQGIDEQKIRALMKESLLHRRLLEANVKEGDTPTEDAVKKFYDDNPKYFQEPERCKASHILLRISADTTGEQKETIKNKLIALKADIENEKISFEEAAKNNSEDPGSGRNGGELGYFTRERMVKPFADAAFSTSVGEMSDIVESEFGYHLIKVTDRKDARTVPLEEAKEKISEYLSGKAHQEAIEKYIDSLRDNAKIEKLVTEEEWKARHPPENPVLKVNPGSSN